MEVILLILIFIAIMETRADMRKEKENSNEEKDS